jgi:hypothetical protein
MDVPIYFLLAENRVAEVIRQSSLLGKGFWLGVHG